MNKMIKVTALAVLLGSLQLFGQDCCVPPRSLCCQMPQTPAYNAPAYVDLCWNVYFTGNFTYWSASEENLELGAVSSAATGLVAFDGTMRNQNFDFAPGFQLGVGAATGLDNWDFFAEYTWFRNTDTVTVSLDPAGTDTLFPVWGKPSVTSPSYFFGEESWQLSMDLVDADLGRNYYVGTALLFRPMLGIRGAFIRQYVSVNYLNESTGLTANNVHVAHKSHSWGVGPRAGLYSSWMLGQGVRLYGRGVGDLLFTRYTTLGTSQTATDAAGEVIGGGITRLTQTNVDYLRPHLDLEIGFGWGTYFYGNRRHVDLSAGYDFQVFFNQNMFRGFSDDSSFSSSLPHGDLFLQGLTLSARFDF